MTSSAIANELSSDCCASIRRREICSASLSCRAQPNSGEMDNKHQKNIRYSEVHAVQKKTGSTGETNDKMAEVSVKDTVTRPGM